MNATQTQPLPTNWRQTAEVTYTAPLRTTRTAESMAQTQRITFDLVTELAKWSQS